MIFWPRITTGDRNVLFGCVFALVPLTLILFFAILLHSALQSCSRPQAESVAAEPPPAPETSALPPDPAASPVPPAAPVPSVPEVPALPETPALPSTPPPVAPPAHAESPAPHFRRIRWGMTPAEVLAAESPVLPVRTTPSTLVFSTTTRDLPTRLAYSFRHGLLAAARLQFSLPSDGDVPALSPVAAHAGYLWLRAQLADRYGAPLETKTTRPRSTTHLSDRAARAREDAAQYAATLDAARRRLADRTARLREKYRNWPEAAARIDRELASERRYVADLEAWVRDTQASERAALSAIDQLRRDDRTSPLLATATATWHPSGVPHAVTLSADCTATPARLEIRYKTTLPLPYDL